MVYKNIKVGVSTRSIIWLMIFTCTFVLYMIRINLSIIILAMVEPVKDENNHIVVPECLANKQSVPNATEVEDNQHVKPTYGQTFDWDKKLQGLMLGSYFWGFTISGIPGGALAEKFGPTKLVALSFLVSGVLTLLGPVASFGHPYLLITSRFLIGLFGGIVYPCLHCLVARWAPPQEKGKFVGALLGGSLGTVVTWPLLGKIIEVSSWSWAFYVNGIIVIIWTVAWMVLVRDNPEVHPRISLEEKEFIVNSLHGSLSNKKRLAPYKDMFTSIPMLALILLHFGNLWGLFFLMTAGPNFMSTVLGFDLGHTGILAMLPYLARLISGFIFGSIGDFIVKKKLMSTTAIRKFFIIFSHVIPGLALCIITLLGCHVNWVIALITISLGSNGAATLTNLQNSQDLAPNFAGSIYGITNCIGSTTGFISPLIVGYMTSEHNGLHEWNIIFYIGATVYIASGLIFCIFGSGEVQPWNNKESGAKDTGGIENIAFEDATEIKKS